MDKKVSVIIVGDNNCHLRKKCIESFKNQKINDVELLYIQEGGYKAIINQASGEFIMFVGENETADQELLEMAVRCGDKSGAEIVLLPTKQFNIETGNISEPAIIETCIEKKLFRKEYLIERFQYIVNDDIKYSKYIGMALLAGTENIVPMNARRLYTWDYKKISGEEILKNYKLLYEDLCIRNEWGKKKQKFLNWLLSDISIWLEEPYCLFEAKDIFRDIQHQLLAKFDILNCGDEYLTSEQSKRGACLIKGMLAGECFALEHNIDYESIPINLIKQGKFRKTPCVSIVLSVFNVEKYVAEALDSLIAQTFSEFEIICVNDGSADKSLEILLQYADKDARISVYHQSNCGPSIARNRAIDVAQGKYIYMMDSDDTLQKTALEMLYNRCEQDNLDVIYFDGSTVFELQEKDLIQNNFNNYYRRIGKYRKNVYKGSELMREMQRNGDYRVSVCLQLIKREHIVSNRISFYPGIIHEDNAFNFFCMMQAERVEYYGIELYNRRVRSDSIMTKKGSFENVYGYLCCYISILNWLQSNDLSNEYYQTVQEILDGLLRSARYQYSLIEPSEKSIINFLKSYERFLCQKLIVER